MHEDTEMTVMKKEVYIHRSLETGGTAWPTEPQRGAPRLVRRLRGSGENMAQSLFWSFARRERARQGKLTE